MLGKRERAHARKCVDAAEALENPGGYEGNRAASATRAEDDRDDSASPSAATP